MEGDTKNEEFSVKISLTANENVLTWQLGFYMPRSFYALTSNTQSINPRLKMSICDSQNNCKELIYQQANSVEDNDKSAGMITILAPQSQFNLVKGKKYRINLLHNNQWNASNYSAVLQNFFILSDNKIYNISTGKSTYKLLNYKEDEIEARISSHVSDNWNNSNASSSEINIVPSLVSYKKTDGEYLIKDNLAIHDTMMDNNVMANLIKTYLKKDLNVEVSIDNLANVESGIIIKRIGKAKEINGNLEGYKISIDNNLISIEAVNNTGVFYAIQTLRQIWNKNSKIAGAHIVDYPRFKYRGVLLDTSRHFFSIEEIKNLIDIMAAHKLNTLHLHFADDEGFRVGLDGYPRITKIADLRGYKNSMIGMLLVQKNLEIKTFDNKDYPYINTDYKGTYSVTDLMELIQYANMRSITIIPEIDLPGHARALIKAFSDSMVNHSDHSKFVSVQGYNDNVIPICTYNDTSTFGNGFTATINSIIEETASIFKQQNTLYAINNEISIGGDEVVNGAWSEDETCTSKSDWNSLNALQKSHKFFGLLAKMNSGIKFSGWQQFIQNEDPSLGNNIVPATQSGHVWVWNTSGEQAGQAQAVTLANSGYKVVLDYADQNYFDLAYTPSVDEGGFVWAGEFLDTNSSLSSAITASKTIAKTMRKDNIYGLEGTLWSENLSNYKRMIYSALPKMSGLSEASWSSSSVTSTNNHTKTNWQDFTKRLGCNENGFLGYLHKIYNVEYRGYPNGISLEAPMACKNFK